MPIGPKNVYPLNTNENTLVEVVQAYIDNSLRTGNVDRTFHT